MAEFLMLGSGSGSYALSKTKTDLFLRSLESYINTIVDVLNKQLVERLWQLNGLDWATMPKLKAGDVAPHDLREIASFLRNINGAGIELQDQTEVVADLMDIAEIEFDSGKYEAKLNKPAKDVADG
jgi:phage gp29-like protein